MELFDKRFVHFMWDDELKGKRCFLEDGIDVLKTLVEDGRPCLYHEVKESNDPNHPFQSNTIGINFAFAYYDPNYEVKKAFNKGKKIQVRCANGIWSDCCVTPKWSDVREYRVKPAEAPKWIAYLARQQNGCCYLTACREDKWEAARDDCGAKTKLFVSSKDKAKEWCQSRQKFAEVIKAFEDGKAVQFRHSETEPWRDVDNPLWYDDCEYRVKLEEKNYRPYVSSAEMIADFINRFKVKCHPYAGPLVWVGHRQQDCRFLITGIFSCSVKINGTLYMLEDLFNCYTYLDGSPVGMEVKE